VIVGCNTLMVMRRKGISIREIAEAVEKSPMAVQRLLKKLIF
jgi:DNA-binding Lrp family transcriptional regulator